jgi:hypothetical protein
VFFPPKKEKFSLGKKLHGFFLGQNFSSFGIEKHQKKVFFYLLFSHWKNPQNFCSVKLTGNQKLSPEFSILEKFHLTKSPILKARFRGENSIYSRRVLKPEMTILQGILFGVHTWSNEYVSLMAKKVKGPMRVYSVHIWMNLFPGPVCRFDIVLNFVDALSAWLNHPWTMKPNNP